MPQTYKDSNYRFTEPIRLFKANDPYYYEVDNIPLRQLQENCLWLKDQVGAVSTVAIPRSEFDELRPYVEGNSNVVKVRPGRYTARINSVDDLSPLQVIAQTAGLGLAELDVFSVLTSNAAALQATFDKFFTYQSSNVTNMNGMAERIFSYPTASSDEPIIGFMQGATYNGFRVGKKQPGYPQNQVMTWEKSNEQTSFAMPSFVEEDLTVGYGVLNVLESYFVKKWRGVARTAVVDVPSELSIDIPSFSEDDFFYINANGVRTKLTGATQRIDLIFIYSKPIDTSGVTIAKFTETYGQETQGTRITKAQLGILKGAGVGLDIQNKGFPEGTATPKQGRDANGNLIMLANPSDELSTTNGFETLNIHGSFPSPEDLLNLSPVLSEYIQTGDLQLIGQTVLPVAYVVVKKTASLNSEGVNILTDEDLIDIRPFFRTAELTYSERSGLAAALPSISLANPAVGKVQLDREIQVVYRSVQGELNDLRSRIGNQVQQSPRPVAAGYILGGGYFGVESVLMNYYYENDFGRNTTWENVREYTRSKLGFPNNLAIPDFPDWDLSNWVRSDTTFTINKGLYPNDYVDVFYSFDELLRYSSFGTGLISTPIGVQMMKKFGTDNIDARENMVSILYCKKKIPFDRSQVQWMQDYHVEVDWLNCVPLTCRAFGENSPAFAAPAGYWVSKEENSFTIHCAWVANDLHPIERVNSKRRLMNGYPFQATPKNNRSNHWFAGFAVTHPSMLPVNTRYINGMSEFGAAIYPSISFKVTGYPGAWQGYVGRLATNQAITFV